MKIDWQFYQWLRSCVGVVRTVTTISAGQPWFWCFWRPI